MQRVVYEKDLEHKLIRPEKLPQKSVFSQTLLDSLFGMPERRAFSIELPDFLVPLIDTQESSSAVTLESKILGMAPQDFAYRVDGDIIHIREAGNALRRNLYHNGTMLRSF